MKEILAVQRKRKIMMTIAQKLIYTTLTFDVLFTRSLFKWIRDWWK